MFYLPNHIRFLQIFFVFSALCMSGDSAFSIEIWQELRGEHFIIQYVSAQDESWAKDVLRKSESYYDKISYQIGYKQYRDFLTWDKRIIVKIYPDQESFITYTGQPAWSKGGAIRHNSSEKTGEIVSYRQSDDFLERVLPHEIGHIILGNFIGGASHVPLWFEEGVAQLQEKQPVETVQSVMRNFAHRGRYIPFKELEGMGVQSQNDTEVIALFYVQSLSVVQFLITKYGSSRFGDLCRHLSEGRSFEDAVKAAYISIFDSLNDVEKKWLKYIQS